MCKSVGVSSIIFPSGCLTNICGFLDAVISARPNCVTFRPRGDAFHWGGGGNAGDPGFSPFFHFLLHPRPLYTQLKTQAVTKLICIFLL